MLRRTSRRLALAVALATAVTGGLVYWTEPMAAFPVIEALTPQLVYRVETTRPLVALSFDDGPHPTFTPQVLDVLERHRARATFFLIGERALRHPDLVARIRREGHEVGNHYFTNRSTLGHSETDFLDLLERTERALALVGSPKLFRPPGGVAWPGQLRRARELGYVCVLGSAYPHDPARPPLWYLRWLTVKNLAPGAIVILHDGIADATRTVAALPDILSAGADRGLTFVSIGTLMREGSAGGETDASLVREPGDAASE
jgi:peptidoglycan/xylan/chitin deacetylase (PgdA/CDA1 family)